MNEEIEVNVESLANAMERRLFEKKLRKIDLSHLNISMHLAHLESDEILKRMLLA